MCVCVCARLWRRKAELLSPSDRQIAQPGRSFGHNQPITIIQIGHTGKISRTGRRSKKEPPPSLSPSPRDQLQTDTLLLLGQRSQLPASDGRLCGASAD